MLPGTGKMETPAHVVFCEYRDPAPPTLLFGSGLAGVLETRQPAEVIPKLAAVEEAVRGGLHAAGFLCYETAPAMDPACRTHPGGALPLLWFGLFRELRRQDAAAAPAAGDFSVGPWQASITPAEHHQAVDRIKDYIARGHTYQVNYTFRLRLVPGRSVGFLSAPLGGPAPGYGAYLDTGRHVICSASPELFFRLDGEVLTTRPMKGTAPRGLTAQEDRQRRRELASSVKERAENAMIVNMMRNDLGRIAERGSVQVASAFDVERYPTVLQMTSTVTARSSLPVVEIMKAIFPPASITGAPKSAPWRSSTSWRPIRAASTPARSAISRPAQGQFNVAIRTVAIDRAAGAAEYGVGGGIVWDSDKAGEYAECQTKTAVLTAEAPAV